MFFRMDNFYWSIFNFTKYFFSHLSATVKTIQWIFKFSVTDFPFIILTFLFLQFPFGSFLQFLFCWDFLLFYLWQMYFLYILGNSYNSHFKILVSYSNIWIMLELITIGSLFLEWVMFSCFLVSQGILMHTGHYKWYIVESLDSVRFLWRNWFRF